MPILHGSPQIWATLRDCIVKKEGEEEEEEEEGAPFSQSRGRERAVLHLDVLYLAKPQVTVRKDANTRPTRKTWQLSIRWCHVFMTFTCINASAVSFCFTWLLGKYVRCCLAQFIPYTLNDRPAAFRTRSAGVSGRVSRLFFLHLLLILHLFILSY